MWPFKKKGSTPKKQKNMMHGHDLDEWHYLGYTVMIWGSQKCAAFLFCKKDDYDVRSYKLESKADDTIIKYHPYISRTLIPWTKGEWEIYSLQGKNSYVSKWLQSYILDTFKSVWDPDTGWWVSTDASKYASASTKQKTEKKKTVDKNSETTDNVVKVDFTKGNE